MISRTTERFWSAYDTLPEAIRRQAREASRLVRQDPAHPSLRFRTVHPMRPIYLVRSNIQYRDLGIRTADTIVWFWIGSHDEYERLLARL